MNWEKDTKGVRIVRRVVGILGELSDYLPLTLRQIHYQLVAGNVAGYVNTQSAYTSLSGWLYDARVDGLIPWEAMTDRVRPFDDLSGFTDVDRYLSAYLRATRQNYRRDLMQTQAVRLELWTEKDALSAVLTRFAKPYSVSVQTCRGFGSGSQFDDVVKRDDGRPLRILYFGDHDPSGLWMSERDIKQRLEDKHGLSVHLERVALNSDQVEEYGLVADHQIPKPGDQRTPWYIDNYGRRCWELDALSPAVLGKLVTTAIEASIDMDLLEAEREQQESDLSTIAATVDRWESTTEPE
jgi:hypothetical protein